jgi:predicted lipoprotein
MQRLLIASMLLLGLTACKEETGGPATQSFDRGSMLAYYADQHIQPAFDSLSSAAQDLHSRLLGLAAQPSPVQLGELRATWTRVYLHWQKAAVFNLGPAAEQGLRKRMSEELGTFPVSETKINNYLNAGDTSFANFDRDSRGLFAIEYLLFAGTDADALNRLAQTPVRNYLLALSNRFGGETSRITTEWRAYRSEFVGNTATSAGSPTVQLYNEFLLSYEGLKNFKLGLPLGLRMGQTQAEPQKVEAFYSGQSLAGISSQMQVLEAFWRGNNSTGFRAYLLASTGGEELVNRTEAQLRIIEARITACGTGRLDSLITANPQPAIDLHTELQRNTRFFKSDMSSLLGLTITFSSGDGD